MSELLDRYQRSLIGVFGTPPLVLSHGEGCYVWDTDGNRYLDLVGGIAVNALGHGHPALVSALSKQAAEAIHISNLFTSVPQIELAERLLQIADAPQGSGVFLANSGAEAIEAAVKLSRRTGRQEIIAADGAFHGRTTGALALTSKAAYREPFEPLMPGVSHVPYGDVDALRAAVTTETAAVVLEPVQGEAGVVDPGPAYLTAAREITSATGTLLIIDEIQTGIGRTGEWFAFQASGIRPDAVTVAKGLGGGVPIGGLITFGPEVSGLLTAGQHGTTFGGNPLATAGALAVLDTIVQEGLLAHATEAGHHLADAIAALEHPVLEPVRGRGLLRAIPLRRPVASALAAAAREAGFIVNPVAPQAIRLAPPLVVTTDQLDDFVSALPDLLDSVKDPS
ncbi:acetylornithine transaminase [Luteipulveratus halotolerans]|uniref:Acetylornithine aminotransferase n=1 Tax=Luteipulveratus halotolerans TaxID=1631356 RepID=A0A0L6CIA0_9MICO|nr:acetylornithine transaminase [Luteipulveratus halotolerans]KNX37355.1 acetylornithine aminotransferase [Luteipulveratus halotolerans]